MPDPGSRRRPIGLVSLPTNATDAIDLVLRSERAGQDTVWLEMSGTEIDALTVLAATATVTEQVRLGTAIVPAFGRHPVTLATQALSLESLAPGRLRLGIGTGNARRMAAALGHPPDRPLARLEEYLRVLRPALHDGTVSFAGEFYSADVQLPEAPGTPVLLAALGARAFAVAGELADGALSWLCPIPYLLDIARPAMATGAQRAGRPVPPLVAHLAVAIGSDPVALRQAARHDIEAYARVPVFARMFAAAGHPVTDGVSDALLDAVAITGDEDQVRSRLAGILDSGVDGIDGIDELMVSLVPGVDLRHQEDVLLGILSELSRSDPVDASERLAVYGSLKPGETNHHLVQDLPGDWRPGVVRGHLHDQGWGARLGFPGIVIDPLGPPVPVQVLTSPGLPAAWRRLDDFEGARYRRRSATVELDDGATVQADIYELRTDHG